MNRTVKHVVGQWLAGSVLMLLLALEVLAVWGWCQWEGYLLVRVFLTAAIRVSFFNTVFAACTHRYLPVRPWQVSVATVALLYLAWHTPRPEQVPYWEQVDDLRIGMSVREVQDTLAPYPISTGHLWCSQVTPATVAAAKLILKPDFTGTVVCNDRLGNGNGKIAMLDFKNGTLSQVSLDPYND